MRSSTKEMMQKLKDRLTEVKRTDIKEGKTTYVSGEALAKFTHLSKTSVYAMIRRLKMSGIGIYYRTGKGYTLAEKASKRDDINTIRKINGRRTSDIITLEAARKHIMSRWSLAEKKQLEIAIKPLMIDRAILAKSNTILLNAKNSLGL